MTKRQAKVRQNRITHVIKRAKERYGLTLNQEDLLSLEMAIREQRGTFIGKQSRDRTWWLVCFEGRDMLAVYSKRSKQITTFLPLDVLKGRDFGITETKITIKESDVKTVYGKGAVIQLSADDLAHAIDTYLLSQNIVVQGPRTITYNKELLNNSCEIYVNTSGYVIYKGEKYRATHKNKKEQG